MTSDTIRPPRCSASSSAQSTLSTGELAIEAAQPTLGIGGRSLAVGPGLSLRQSALKAGNGTPSDIAELPPVRAISRLAALCERSAGVAAVTTVGALLANLPGTTTADMGACLHDLCRDLTASFDRPNAPRLNCNTAPHHLPTGTVITLGLIADLLLTNAYTFGFVPPAGGRIAVAFSALEASFELTIEDSGLVHHGSARRRTDGVTIARLLVRELGGWLETPRVVGGSRCIITVPRHSNCRSR